MRKAINSIIDKKEFELDPDFNELNKGLNSIGFSIEVIEIRKQTVLCEIKKLNFLK